jgi:hypothetical protein
VKNFKQYLVPEQKPAEKKELNLLEQAWLKAKEKAEKNRENYVEPTVY